MAATEDETAELAAAVGRLLAAADAGPDSGPVRGLTRLSGGASRETWAFTSGGRELILRRDPPGRPSPPGGMAREAAAMRACGRAGLAVPEVLADDDGSVLGTEGLVMTRVPGEALARRILREDAYAAARPRLASQLGTFLAGLHAIDPAEVPGLEPSDPLADYRAAYDLIDDASPTFEAAHRWLVENRPPPAGQTVVHGDLRLGNVIVDEDGLAAVIDWELAHLGDPVEDLAWMCVRAWRFRSPLPVAGVGTVDELLGAYEDASGRAVDRDAFHWWLVQKTLQWGIQCMGQAAAHLTGLLRSVELAAIGRRVAEQEWDLLELLAPDAWAAARAEAEAEASEAAAADDHPRRRRTDVRDDGDPPLADLYGRPTAGELVEAVREFLSERVMPGTAGAVSFHARVAANALGVVERELALGPAHAVAHDRRLDRLGIGTTRELCLAIRAGRFDDDGALWTCLAADARDRLRVANPRHLAAPAPGDTTAPTTPTPTSA
jgi:aminoglycoside phosphotransferase (APT) family kinase protein